MFHKEQYVLAEGFDYGRLRLNCDVWTRGLMKNGRWNMGYFRRIGASFQEEKARSHDVLDGMAIERR